jgi:hypothetical protein
MPRENYYASEIANTPEVVRAGFEALIKVTGELKAQKAWLVCDSKQNLEGHIKNSIGEAAAKALQKGRCVTLPTKCLLSFYAERTLPLNGENCPILACFPSAKLLDKLDALLGVTALIVLPWSLDEIRPWLAAHGAKDILGGADVVPVTVSNPVVAEALKSILLHINLNTGVGHPSDKHAVIEAFRILKRGGEAVDPDEVRAWLVQEGMEPRHANTIAEIAADPTKFRHSERTSFWSPDILQAWKKSPNRS